jgi:hypothetical protein
MSLLGWRKFPPDLLYLANLDRTIFQHCGDAKFDILLLI